MPHTQEVLGKKTKPGNPSGAAPGRRILDLNSENLEKSYRREKQLTEIANINNHHLGNQPSTSTYAGSKQLKKTNFPVKPMEKSKAKTNPKENMASISNGDAEKEREIREKLENSFNCFRDKTADRSSESASSVETDDPTSMVKIQPTMNRSRRLNYDPEVNPESDPENTENDLACAMNLWNTQSVTELIEENLVQIEEVADEVFDTDPLNAGQPTATVLQRKRSRSVTTTGESPISKRSASEDLTEGRSRRTTTKESTKRSLMKHAIQQHHKKKSKEAGPETSSQQGGLKKLINLNETTTVNSQGRTGNYQYSYLAGSSNMSLNDPSFVSNVKFLIKDELAEACNDESSGEDSCKIVNTRVFRQATSEINTTIEGLKEMMEGFITSNKDFLAKNQEFINTQVTAQKAVTDRIDGLDRSLNTKFGDIDKALCDLKEENKNMKKTITENREEDNLSFQKQINDLKALVNSNLDKVMGRIDKVEAGNVTFPSLKDPNPENALFAAALKKNLYAPRPPQPLDFKDIEKAQGPYGQTAEQKAARQVKVFSVPLRPYDATESEEDRKTNDKEYLKTATIKEMTTWMEPSTKLTTEDICHVKRIENFHVKEGEPKPIIATFYDIDKVRRVMTKFEMDEDKWKRGRVKIDHCLTNSERDKLNALKEQRDAKNNKLFEKYSIKTAAENIQALPGRWGVQRFMGKASGPLIWRGSSDYLEEEDLMMM